MDFKDQFELNFKRPEPTIDFWADGSIEVRGAPVVDPMKRNYVVNYGRVALTFFQAQKAETLGWKIVGFGNGLVEVGRGPVDWENQKRKVGNKIVHI